MISRPSAHGGDLHEPLEGSVKPGYVVAMAASAGGLKALLAVLSALPQDFPAAIVIVQHLSRHHPSVMAEILRRHTALKTKQAENGDELTPGTIYCAPPDWHLLVGAGGVLSLSHAAVREHVRPSADLLFESVAESFGDHAIAVVLSGTGRDGAAGIVAVKAGKGVVIAQDEASAEYFGMPGAAIETGKVDFILPLGDIATRLMSLVKETS